MERDWNIRLKQKRNEAKLTLKDVSNRSDRGLTQQSLIAYESGKIFPRIDVLDDLCKIYECDINYILYGLEKGNLILSEGDCLITIWYLLVTNKMIFEKEYFYIVDENLKKYSNYFDLFIKNHDIASVKDLYTLIRGAKNVNADHQE